MIEIAEKYGFLTNALQFLGRPGNIGKIMDLADNLLPCLYLGCQIHDGMGAIAYCAVADDISVLEELHTHQSLGAAYVGTLPRGQAHRCFLTLMARKTEEWGVNRPLPKPNGDVGWNSDEVAMLKQPA